MTNPSTDAHRAARLESGKLAGFELYDLHCRAYVDMGQMDQKPWNQLGKTRQKVFNEMAKQIHVHYVRFMGNGS